MGLIKQVVEKLVTYRREKREQEIREFLDIYHASHAWTLLKCPMCELPATAPDAKFCVYCGASMSASSSLLHPAYRQDRTTGPVRLPAHGQTFLAYVRTIHQDTGPHTQLHRAIQKEKARS